MDNLEYQLTENRKALETDIAERLHHQNPEISLDESYRLGAIAVERISQLGNSALHNGLVNYGIQIAKENL